MCIYTNDNFTIESMAVEEDDEKKDDSTGSETGETKSD